MPIRLSAPQTWSRTFSTTCRSRTAIPPQFHAYNPTLSAPTPKLGRIARWYLPTMALLAVGMVYLPASYFTPPPQHRRTVTLDSANRQINFAITNALDHHNHSQSPTTQAHLPQEEKTRMLLDAYGERSRLEDMERAFEMMSLGQEETRTGDPRERNRRLLDAYGEKTSLRDLERAMEIYEVQ